MNSFFAGIINAIHDKGDTCLCGVVSEVFAMFGRQDTWDMKIKTYETAPINTVYHQMRDLGI